MDFKIISSSEGVALIENNNERFLAIDSGLKNRSFVGVDTSKLQSLPGLIIDNGEIINWKLQGITEIEERTFFYGPYIKGESFSKLKMSPEILLELTSALNIIKDRKFPVHHFSLNSVFRTEDGKILFFPPYLMDFLNSHRKRKDSMNMIVPWNNPGLGGNKGRSFTIAALAYRTITGELPFPGKDEEEIEKLMSKVNYKSPLSSEPLLKKEITSAIEDSFSGKGDLGKWTEVLSHWEKEGLHDTSLTSVDKNRIIENQKKIEAKRVQSNKVRNYLQKNRNKLIIGAVSILTLLMIIQAPLSKYLEPPVTMGMGKKEVIDLYYSCFKTFNTEIMDDCITQKAGKNDINEISTIYVTSKVRTSYEGSSGMIDPELWKSEGMKPVEQGVQVWGLAELTIKQISADIYEVSYEKWTPAIVEDMEDNSLKMPVGYTIVDTIHLSIIKDAWKIDELERVTSKMK